MAEIRFILLRRRLLLLIAALLLGGCQDPEATKPRLIDPSNGNDLTDLPPTTAVSLGVANYSDEPLGTVFINEQWAGPGYPQTAGSGGMCCIRLPRVWQEGLKVKVSWRSDTMWEQDPKSLAEREILVPRYPPFADGAIWFMYFPGDEIRVVVAPGGPGGTYFGYDIERPELEKDSVKVQRFLQQTAWTVVP